MQQKRWQKSKRRRSCDKGSERKEEEEEATLEEAAATEGRSVTREGTMEYQQQKACKYHNDLKRTVRRNAWKAKCLKYHGYEFGESR